MSLVLDHHLGNFSKELWWEEALVYFRKILSRKITSIFWSDTHNNPIKLLSVIETPEFTKMLEEAISETLNYIQKSWIKKKIYWARCRVKDTISFITTRNKWTYQVIKKSNYNPLPPLMNGACILWVMNFYDSIATNFLWLEPRFGPALNTLMSIPWNASSEDSNYSLVLSGNESLQLLSHPWVVAAAIGIFVVRLRKQGIKVAMKDWTFGASIAWLGLASMNSIDTTIVKWLESDPFFWSIIDGLVSEYAYDLWLKTHQTNTIYELTPAVCIALLLFITNNITRQIPEEYQTKMKYHLYHFSQLLQNSCLPR